MGKASRQVNQFMNNQQPKPSKEQVEHERKVRRMQLEVAIQNTAREVAFKQEQIQSGDIKETRTRHILPDGTCSLVDAYVDGKKPLFLLENEIDELNARIQINMEQLDYMKQVEEKENADIKKS